MGVIKKKTAVRGTEGGVKYVCDICSVDITSTVRIRCANDLCHEYDLCVPCFSEGKATREHDPRTHSYQVIEQHSIPIYSEDWGADEELLLLEGAETYGLGSWADIADHIGGMRTKDEVRRHYEDVYVNSNLFPLPEHASPEDRTFTDSMPREEFQARKKRRIEERKEAAKSAPPAPPKQKPTASVPACHEVQGFMPGRLEFEQEHLNDAEEAVQHMYFEPGEGMGDPKEHDEETQLKMTIYDIYGHRLDARLERKRVIFEHKLLEYRKNMASEKKRTKDEKDLYQKAKPFARMMNHDDFEDFARDLLYEHNLRLAIAQLQEWRQLQIGELKAGDRYESEKQQRNAKPLPTGSFDRHGLSSNRLSRPALPNDAVSATSPYNAPELPTRIYHGLHTPPPSESPHSDRNGTTNGTGANGVSTPVQKPKFTMQPLPGTQVLKLNNEIAPDLQLLTPEEKEVCANLRMMPKPYLAIKEVLFREAMKQGGALKKKAVKDICKIEVKKGEKLFEFFVHSGWIARA